MATMTTANHRQTAAFGASPAVVWHTLEATRAAAIAAAAWAGRGDSIAADGAATAAMRTVLGALPGSGVVVTGEGAKDGAPMLADGERLGDGHADEFDLAVDPVECTDLCARGLAGALSTAAVAPAGTLWRPGPSFYMDKLVVGAPARGATRITDPAETTVAKTAEALGCARSQLRVIVLDKPRHRELIERLRATGASVATPPAGDVAAALAVALGDADLLLGVGGTPEGVLAACAVAALGGEMQARLAPQREDERDALRRAGYAAETVMTMSELASAPATFIATGITGGLLDAPRRTARGMVTDSLLVARGAVMRLQHTTPTQE